ncbi:Hypothetical protein A7982_03930 [Minicystis rosea]|nr:Hypothetical protein A7982_03930 [Minicystis rosea]
MTRARPRLRAAREVRADGEIGAAKVRAWTGHPLGIVATCRAIGVPVQAYLTWVFERLGTHREMFGLALEALTPAAFKAARG